MKIIAIGGVPASGKSSIVKEVMLQLGQGLATKVQDLDCIVFQERKFIVLGIYRQGEVFSGTDRYSMAIQPKAVQFFQVLNDDPNYDDWTVLFEGDRLFNGKFLEFITQELQVKYKIVFITASEEVLAQRHSSRDNQDGTWLKGRVTKVERLKSKYNHSTTLQNNKAEDVPNCVASILSNNFATPGGIALDSGYYGSPRWSYEFLDCAMPMTFDTYSNCAHQCLYCFSFFQRAIGLAADDYLHHKVTSVNVDKIKQMFLKPDEFGGQFKDYIKSRLVMQWGGLSDGFDWYERKFRKSLELLKFFKEIEYPISISSKGTWFLDDPEYIEVLKGSKNIHWKMSIITTNEEHVKGIEPGTPSAAERFLGIRKLSDLGIPVTLRYRPFIIGTSDLSIEDAFTKAERSGCISTTTEFLCWEMRASVTSKSRLDAMSKVLGYDIWKFYVDNNTPGGLMRLNYDIKRPYIEQMKESAARHHLKFYVSDAHHKHESNSCNCCGNPETGILANCNRGQYAQALQIAKHQGFVKWSDIEEDVYKTFGNIPFLAEGFNQPTITRALNMYNSLADYMHTQWNDVKSLRSLTKYFAGTLVPSGLDEKGDIIYLYNKPFIETGQKVVTVDELAKNILKKDTELKGDEVYPIYVFSKGRWNSATTPRLLGGLKYTLVVPEDEVAQYISKYPVTKIISVSEKGILAAHRTIYNHAIQEGHTHAWFLHDDILKFKGRQDQDVLAYEVVSRMEAFEFQYANIAMLTICNQELRTILTKFRVNEPGLRNSMYLINLTTGISFEDLNVELLTLPAWAMLNMSKGFYCTVQSKDFYFTEAIGLSGGCASLYLKGEQRKAVEKLVEQYPDYFISVDMPKPMEKDLALISRYTNALQSKAVLELTKE